MGNSEILNRILTEPKGLSEDQRKAVTSGSKYLRVIAGAGAGKTETLTRRIAYLPLCEEVDPSKIVAFTFTEKAAQSMKSRLYQRISQVGREDILRRLGDMYPRRLVESALRRGAAALVLAHNHPNGLVQPSEHDKVLTRGLVHAAETVHLETVDHLIVSPDEALSFRKTGLL